MIGAFQTRLLALISAFHLIFSRLCTFSAASQSRAVFFCLLSLFLKSFCFIRESQSHWYEAFLNVPWTFGDGFPPSPLRPFNCDSFHFPSWILTVVWSSSHPLPSHLFCLQRHCQICHIFLIRLVKNSQILAELVQSHARFPASYLPPLSHNIIQKAIAFLDLPEHTVQDRRSCFFIFIFRPRPCRPEDSPGAVPLPSCPFQASVRFNRLRSCCRGNWFTKRLVCRRSVFQTRRSASHLSQSQIFGPSAIYHCCAQTRGQTRTEDAVSLIALAKFQKRIITLALWNY